MTVVLSIDAGTTGVRTLAFDAHGALQASSYREFPQHFPRPGWVEHDPEEIWSATLATLGEVVDQLRNQRVVVAGIGITNQRETTVLWDRTTGAVPHRAIVWQDRRTAARCDELRGAGVEPLVRAQTGLVLDPYFSATKLEWLFGPGGVEPHPDLAFGTVDSWILWRLTGGTNGGVHATDPSNASRTMLYDIGARAWSDELLDVFGLAPTLLPEVLPSSGRFGTTVAECAAGLVVSVAGIAGDQQAALFGQACFDPGMTKNTYGTGSFVLMNVGETCPAPVPGLLTTVAWALGDTFTYALEGSIFVTGAAIQWLRDGLRIIDDASETEALASSVPDSGGVVFVPALTGLGSPYWDPYARGTVLGLTRGTGRAHLVRAVVESMVWQTRDVVDAMTAAAGHPITELRVDGGASVMDLLCRLQADALGVPVRRPAVKETTALGAAYLAGIAEGVWSSPADAAAAWASEASFEPTSDDAVEAGYTEWTRAVERSRGWAAEG
ncbi:MAG TPA: glycerol kinase GlpK [Acidimicrobiia bacterium]|nr:glycerol kinase GlpK [Acidimicrobiia bacterium]